MTSESIADIATGVTLGVTGQRARWNISSWGAITEWGEPASNGLDWYIAADDRWHIPAREPTVRQERVEGTPVVETRVRVPDGDAVQRAWAVPDGGGATMVEFENESPLPFAIALSGPPVVTGRPASDVPIRGIDLDDDAIVLPVGHRSIVRVALPSVSGSVRWGALDRIPPAMAVVRGWTQVVEQASRLVLPDERLVGAVVGARCDLLLEGPVSAQEDPVGFVLDVAELVRCGDDPNVWLLEVVEPAERLARHASKTSSPPSEVQAAQRALHAAQLVAIRAGDQRASADIGRAMQRIADRHPPDGGEGPPAASLADLRRADSAGRFVRSVERRLADAGRLLDGGLPTSWRGNNFEVHDVPTSAATSVSFAVRWHGERPAVLWEQRGDAPMRLSAPDLDPGWSTVERSGEALWTVPARRGRESRPISVETDDAVSFG